MQFPVTGRGEAFRTLMPGDAYRRQLHPHSRFACHNRFRARGWQLLPVKQERSKSPGVDGNIDRCDAADLSDLEGLSLSGSNPKAAGLPFFMDSATAAPAEFTQMYRLKYPLGNKESFVEKPAAGDR